MKDKQIEKLIKAEEKRQRGVVKLKDCVRNGRSNFLN
jgi:hypothetical protein